MSVRLFCLLLFLDVLFFHAVGVSRGAERPIDVPHVEGITIDGNADDWADRGFRVNVMVPGNGGLLTEGSSDARFRLAWNQRGLLVLATVHQPPQGAHTTTKSAKSIDSVEVLIARPGTIDRYLTIVTPFHADGEPAWSTKDFRQLMADRKRPLVANASAKTSPNDYVVEALLPWENLSIKPEAGAVVQVQVRVNRGDDQYRWNPGAGNKVEYMYLIRLSAEGGGAPADLALTGSYERLQQIKMTVIATGDFVGKSVDVMDGDHVLASGLLSQIGSRAQAALVLPMPPLGKSYGPINARIEKRVMATIQLPDAEALRDDAVANVPLQFNPLLSSADHFSDCEFANPQLVKELFGRYVLRANFYDAEFNLVTQPAKAGWYGAVVEVRSQEKGKSFKRYCALNRPADAMPAKANEDAGKPDAQWWYHLKRKTGDFANLSLTYLPKDYDKDKSRRWPMILFLHGAGERGDDLNKLKTWGIPLLCEQGKNSEFIAICPLCPARESWLPLALNDLLDEQMTKYRIDPDRVYITGASMGGNGTWNFAQRYPSRVAAIAPVCGGGDPNNVVPLKDVPVWIFHGEKDPVVPFRREQAMIDALDKIDGRVRLTVYPGIGHECWNAAYGTPEMIPWLLAQRRGEPAQPAAMKPEIVAP